MKSTKIIIGAIAVALISVFASCSKSNDKMVVGKWKIADMKIAGFDLSTLPAEQKAAFDKQMAEMKEKSYLEVKEDGSYENVNWAGQEYKSSGKWHFIEDGKKLVMLDGPRMDTITVVSLTDNTMEWDIKGN